MKNTAAFAIVGCGRIAPNHLDAIAHAPSAKLVAVCDISEEKAKKAALENGLSKWYTDAKTMFESESIDVCCVLVPSGLHHEIAILAAEHGIHVLCEKPLDVTEEAMAQMIDACRRNQVKLGGIFQRRTFSAAQETKRAIAEGRFGTVTIGDAYLKYYRDQAYYDSGEWRGTWKLDGGGALMNQGIHGIDLISWMMGGVHSVWARCEQLVWNTEVEDTAVISVKFKNGAIGVIEGTTSVFPGLDTVFSIGGSNGNVCFGDSGFYSWQFNKDPVPQPETVGSMGGLNCAYSKDNLGHTIQVEDMARAVLDDREPMVTGEDARSTVRIILAIYESARTGHEIVLNEFL